MDKKTAMEDGDWTLARGFSVRLHHVKTLKQTSLRHPSSFVVSLTPQIRIQPQCVC